MDWRISLFLIISIAAITWIIARARQKKFEKEFYSISGMMSLEGDLTDRLSWIQNQPFAFQHRMNNLYVLGGFLACRVDTLKSAMNNFTTDRVMARLQATLDEVDNDSFELDKFTAKSMEALQTCALLTRKSARTLLHQLAVETTRNTNKLLKDKEARHHFRVEMDCLGSLMHKAGVLADEADQLLSEPLIDDANPEPPTEGT